jgi:hypothetical protein
MNAKENGALAWSDTCPDYCDPIRSLYSWSANCEGFKPFRVFLDLIGYSEEQGIGSLADYAEPSKGFGYMELGKLGEALTAYSDRPSDLSDFIEELLEVEREFGL